MWDAIGIIGLLTTIVALIGMVVVAIRRTGTWKKWLAGAGVAFVVSMVGAVNAQHTTKSENQQTSTSQQQLVNDPEPKIQQDESKQDSADMSESNNNAPATSNIQNEVPIAPAQKMTTNNDNKITKAEFDQIRGGMSYEEVKYIIGGEGEILSESGNPGDQFYTVMYSYKGKGSLGANANFMFQDGQLQNKAQFGLK